MVYDDCSYNAAMFANGQGPGGVKFITTSSTGKVGTTGRSFVCRR
jgi:hypothetical protein